MIEMLLTELHEQLRDLKRKVEAIERKVEAIDGAVKNIDGWIAIENYKKNAVILTRSDIIRTVMLWVFIFLSGFSAGDVIDRLR